MMHTYRMAASDTPADPAAVTVLWPGEWRVPAILSVPHSGRVYPDFFRHHASTGTDMAGLEDPFLDLLLPDIATLGIPVVIARYGRAYVDANRAPTEWDQGMFADSLPKRFASDTGRVRAGLGTFPRFVPPRQPVNRRRLKTEHGIQRWLTGYRPYHRTLKHLMHTCRTRFGYAMLVDLHSMPQLPGERLPDLVIGDGFGRACSTSVPQSATRAAQAIGLSVARNYPYAGGFITQNYGAPSRGFHALQLEFSRPLYMNEQTRELKPEKRLVSETVTGIIQELGLLDPSLLRPAPTALAGED
jgi:N-formylglutamate amidohydrolase